MTCNFNCSIKNEGLVKITDSCILCRSDYISETMQDGDVVTAGHW